MGSILCGNDYSIYIYYFAIFEVNTKHKRYNVGYSFKDAFHKLLFVKGEIILFPSILEKPLAIILMGIL